MNTLPLLNKTNSDYVCSGFLLLATKMLTGRTPALDAMRMKLKFVSSSFQLPKFLFWSLCPWMHRNFTQVRLQGSEQAMPVSCDSDSCVVYNITTASLWEQKSPGRENPPPQRDKDFQVEVVQGRDRRSPTLQKLSEKSCRMLCLNYIQVAWLVLSADVRRVSQSALCPTGEPEQGVQWKRKWCKAGNFIYSLSEKILSSKSYSMAKGTNTISSFNLDTGLNKILFETIE